MILYSPKYNEFVVIQSEGLFSVECDNLFMDKMRAVIAEVGFVFLDDWVFVGNL